jgi:beta-aspartyl-peptidase (threonine type)
MKPAILTHGGAGAWKDHAFSNALEGMREATEVGWRILLSGGSALDAVEKATNVLEDRPSFDAGIGSFLNAMGEVEMDALIADGTSLNFGAVAAVRHVQHPITLARLVMAETPHCFVVAEGADLLAAELGLPIIPNVDFITDEQFNAFRNRHAQQVEALGTVGAVAIDSNGHIASATSTGGTLNKRKGRVGDSPLFGAGGYADDRYGAASATGKGENIMRVLLSKYAVDQLAQGLNAQEAAAAACHYISGCFAEPNCGIIVVDRHGNLGTAHTTYKMPVGWVDGTGQLQVSMGNGLKGLL